MDLKVRPQNPGTGMISLEDVHDRDPIRRNPLSAHLFSPAGSPGFVATFPRGTRGDRTAVDHPLTLTMSARSPDCVRRRKAGGDVCELNCLVSLAARRSVSDFTRLMLALALHATRDDPSIVLQTTTGPR
jgi:hypothetical protein